MNSTHDDLRSWSGLVDLIRRLRDPESGCPWDLAQTHESLKPHLLEEAYETLEALDRGDPAALREELGDLLLQIVLHARIAEQAGEFETADVIEGIARKLLRRHPHVFGPSTLRLRSGQAGSGRAEAVKTADEVAHRWDELKRAERSDDPSAGSGQAATVDTSALGGVPAAMPALARAQALLGRAERAGFVWPTVDDALAKVVEEARELAVAPDTASRREEFGDLLWALAALARKLDLDAEEALRMAAAKFEARFRAVESLARERGIDMRTSGLDALLALWDEAKRAEGAS